jgi:5'-nucleotidase (lipoprotein e(P4) family)
MKRLAVLSLVLAAGCAHAAASSPRVQAPAAVGRPALPKEIHWYRNAAEMRAIYLQTYRLAAERLRDTTEGRRPGTWAVIMDADETVLDNSTYQKERWQVDSAYTEASWNAWVRRSAAPALPGAAEFIRTARELGGRVVLVTNRGDEVCSETRENLRRLGIAVDAVLCKPSGSSDKAPRFRAVAEGTAATGLPPMEVLMWVGDNIQDFPGLSQDVRVAPEADLARIGRSWIILPNPMYGSWERNPMQ